MLLKALDAVGGLKHFIQPGDVVLVKPNVAFDRSPNLGATTNPAIIDTLVRLLLVDARAAEVRIADNPIESPADCFAKSGIGAAAEQAGGRVYLPDPNAFEVLYTPGAKLIEEWAFFKRPFKNVNKVIGIAPAKDHNLCHASLGIKNWYGLLGGRRNQFHQDIHEIVSDLSIMIRPTLTIVDGTRVLMENGPTGGDPSNVRDGNAILAGVDPVAIDAWAFEHLLQRPGRLPDYLYMAEQKEPVNRKVALKIIKLGMDTKQVMARFDAERQALDRSVVQTPVKTRVLERRLRSALTPAADARRRETRRIKAIHDVAAVGEAAELGLEWDPAWAAAAIRNVAAMGYFSSDRAILEYADKVWNLESVAVKTPQGG